MGEPGRIDHDSLFKKLLTTFRALPIASFEALAEAILDLDTAQDLERWLAQHA